MINEIANKSISFGRCPLGGHALEAGLQSQNGIVGDLYGINSNGEQRWSCTAHPLPHTCLRCTSRARTASLAISTGSIATESKRGHVQPTPGHRSMFDLASLPHTIIRSSKITLTASVVYHPNTGRLAGINMVPALVGWYIRLVIFVL
jgi:hypothetical protein